MESTPDAYRELYLLTNNGMFDRNQSKASLYSVERSQILEVAAYLNEKLNGNVEFREDSYWVLEADGPRPIDFSAVGKEVAQITPPDSHCTDPRCGLDMKGLELRSLMQRKNAECHACDYLGWVTAPFPARRLSRHSGVIPLRALLRALFRSSRTADSPQLEASRL